MNIRAQHWSRVYTATLAQTGDHTHAAQAADEAVKAFNKRFNADGSVYALGREG